MFRLNLSFLQQEACRSPLVLPVLTAVMAVLAVDGSIVGRMGLFAFLALAFLLQGKKGGIAALLLAGILGGLHSYRTHEQERWTDILSKKASFVFAGSAVQSRPGTLVLEGYPEKISHDAPLAPCLLEVKLPRPTSSKSDKPTLPMGKRYIVEGDILPEELPPNPGEFHHADWAARQGISARMLARKVKEAGKGSWKSSLLEGSRQLNEYLCRRLDVGLTEGDPRGDVIKSLVLGARQEASPETIDLFRLSGLLHIFAVSGLHVGLVTLLVSPLLLLAGLRPRPFCISLSLILLLYAFATGLSVSAIRATLMIITVMAGLAFTRKSSSANRLALAAFLILVWNSQALFQLGFLLSFAIFATVVAAVHSFTVFHAWLRPDDYIPALLYTKRERITYALKKNILCALFVSVAAWFVASLILAPQIGYISPYTPLINTLLSLPVSLLMANGLLCLVLGWVPFLGSLLFASCQYLAGILLYFAAGSLSLPGAITPLSPPPPPHQVTIFSLYGTDYAAAMGTPSLLLNPGSAATARNIIAPGLLAEGFRPQMIALPQQKTHDSEGIAIIKERYPIRKIFPSGENSCSTTLSNGAGGTLTFLDPPSELYSSSRQSENSCVYLWKQQGRKILFFGDAGYNAEKRIMNSYPDLQADVLVLGHHSQDYSGSPDFIRYLNPLLIIHTAAPPFSPDNRMILQNKQDSHKKRTFWDLKKQGAIRLLLTSEKLHWKKASPKEVVPAVNDRDAPTTL